MMPYPENIVVRLLICIVGMTALWLGGSFIVDVLINHQEFTFQPTYLVIPVILGVVEAFIWKPKE